MKAVEFHKFKIRHTVKDGVNIGMVYMDGQELQGVRSFDVSVGVDEIPRVKIEFITYDIDYEECRDGNVL